LKRPMTDEDVLERAGVDGRVAFAMAAFALGAGLVALLDRVGVPEKLVGALGPFLALFGLTIIGLLLRSMRVSRFYAGGRAVPAPYAGLALAALGAGLFAPFVPPLSQNVSLAGLLAGFGSGITFAALVTGPFLRKTGAFSIPDLLSGRFPNLALRLGVIIVIAAMSLLVAIAGFNSAIDALVAFGGVSRIGATIALGFVLFFVAVPSGLSGVVWAATGAAGILIASLALPLVFHMGRGGSLPLPVLGDETLWQGALDRLSQWHTQGTQAPAGADFTLILAIAIGICALAPILSPAITATNRDSSQRAGLVALVWALVITALVAATIALSTLSLDKTMIGARPDRLPDHIYQHAARGELTLCGAAVKGPAEARAACAGPKGPKEKIGPGDYAASGSYLVMALSELQGVGLAFSGLVCAALVSISMVLAAASLQSFATSIGHDGLYRVRDRSALTSRRLAMTRVIYIAAVFACGLFLARKSIDGSSFIALALTFSAASIAPLLALTLWPRATGPDAVITLLIGLVVAEAVILAGPAGAPSIERLSGAALLGCVAGFFSGWVSSLMRNADTSASGAFVHQILHGEGEVMNPDKGA